MYKPVNPRVDFPRMEEEILKFWEENNTFKRSIEQRRGGEEFVFYDGPPFATGLPHFGHFVPGTIKDIIPRYQTMRGKMVERRFGWDCHGLPVEYEMEKELGISGKREIEEMGVARFNESCRSIVLRYTAEWRKIVTRAGRWVDFDNDYKTMDPDYMESIWWVVRSLWDRELLKQGYYILPYCPRCSTALSNFELNLGGYRDVQDPSITVRFRLDDGNPPAGEETYLLAWTTTPWTLPSNLAVAVGPEVEYVKVRDGGEHYILARDRLESYYRHEEEYEIVREMKGSDLEGIRYEPLFPFFSDLAERGAFRAFLGDFVSTDEGTGIVHMAPGFGEDDYNTLKDTGIPTVCPVDEEGRFTAEVPPYRGQFVKDADRQIMKDLKEQGKLVKRQTIQHSYPHCWRCSSPLIYRAITSWFVRIDRIKDRMIAANRRITWMPEHLKEGRFGKWLEGARDWAISRNRYWGNPIPIWKCGGCGAMVCVGSRAELEKLSGREVTDLHKHFVDDITFPCGKCGAEMRRIPEVLDCWFESGAMPYAQSHYPFENKEHFEAHFPADFISEALDQTRGWFYTLVVLGAALFNKPAFKNVVVNGMVLDASGKKMSKSVRNYTDPSDVMNRFGADALRLVLIDSALLKAEDLKYSDEAVREALKNVIIPLWNAYSFFVTYANIDGAEPDGPPQDPVNPLDRWVLSETERVVAEMNLQIERYDLQKAVAPFIGFIDGLNNWYIRRSRRRFWRSENDLDKAQAYQTLYAVLMKIVLAAAPFVPFITEEIYRNLRPGGSPDSVHLCDYPVADAGLRSSELEHKMASARAAVSLGRALRSLHGLKIRQPLRAFHLVTRDPEERRILIEMQEIIREELNVKDVIFRENEEELVSYRAQPDYRRLGKELGRDMKLAAEKIRLLGTREIQSIIDGATLFLDLGTRELKLSAEDLKVVREEKENLKVLNEGSLTVALDPELTEELVQEGMVRDLVRSVQNLRKEQGLEVTDRIDLLLSGSGSLKEAVKRFEEHLLAETLAVSWSWRVPGSEAEDRNAVTVKCGGEICVVALRASGRTKG